MACQGSRVLVLVMGGCLFELEWHPLRATEPACTGCPVDYLVGIGHGAMLTILARIAVREHERREG